MFQDKGALLNRGDHSEEMRRRVFFFFAPVHPENTALPSAVNSGVGQEWDGLTAGPCSGLTRSAPGPAYLPNYE